jgi:hypothetical protein
MKSWIERLLRRRGRLDRAEVAAWDMKVAGSAIARQLYAAGMSGHAVRFPEGPSPAGLEGRLCRQADIESPWLHHWCRRLFSMPIYHRKVWEDCFVLGQEALPSLLAAEGVEVLATDLAPAARAARGWLRTAQHAGGGLEKLHYPHLIPREAFDARVRYQDCDMRRIPQELRQGGFDLLWSVCSFEHLGSIEAGLDFVVQAMACLRPGGIAVHTTEFNLDADGPTAERGPTVLFQRRHIEALLDRLRAAGHAPLPVDFSPGEGVLDQFVDLPPYADRDNPVLRPVPVDAPSLRVLVRGCVGTSIGLVIRAGGG